MKREVTRRKTTTCSDLKPLSRPDAVRAFCRDCMPDSSPSKWDMIICPLYPFRLSIPQKSKINRTKAVHQECLNCMGGDKSLVASCESTHCSLWKYRTPRRGIQTGINESETAL